METEPPNFTGTYPLAGELIGPAWRLLWKRLTIETWTSGNALAHELAGVTALKPKTLKNLLGGARRAGILHVQMIKDPDARQACAHYRVANLDEKA